jgi:hypothetical protein
VFNDEDHNASHDEGKVVDHIHVDNVPQGGDDNRQGRVTDDAFQGCVEFPGLVLVVKEGGKETVLYSRFTFIGFSSSEVCGISRFVPLTGRRRDFALVHGEKN